MYFTSNGGMLAKQCNSYFSPYAVCGLRTPATGFRNPCQENSNFEFQSLAAGFWIPRAEFRFPKRGIPHSTS